MLASNQARGQRGPSDRGQQIHAAVGVLLKARTIHTSPSAENHLRAMAACDGYRRRVETVIDRIRLREVTGRRTGCSRSGWASASALLGDPATVMLAEPVNRLDR